MEYCSSFAYTSAAIAQQPAAEADDAEKKLATVGGRLTDANTGEPVRKATLSLMQMPSGGAVMTGPPPATTVTTDSEGKFSFMKVEPGTYMLTAEKTGYVRQQYGSRGGQFGGSSIVVKAGDKFASLDFRLPRQAVITGKVLDEDGEPVPNAMVSTMRLQPFGRQPQMMGGQSTNDIGEFRVANLTPGKYFIRVQKGGYFTPQLSAAPADDKKDQPKLDYLPTYYPNATDVASAAPIVVSSGQQVDGVNVQLKKGRVYQVSGKISGIAPGTRTQISVQEKTNSRIFMGGFGGTSTKPDGSFILPSVQPGTYNLIVMSYDGGRSGVVGRTEITVSNANVENINISAGSAIDITGRVIPDKTEDSNNNDPATNKLSGQVAIISANHMPNFGPPGRIQDDGTFKLTSVSRDKFLITVYGLPANQYVKSVMAGSVDISENGIDLTAAESAPPIEIRLSAKGASVDGAVVDNDGKPVIGSMVLMLPQPYDPDKASVPMYRKSTTTDQTGHFSLKAIAPGEYRLYAWESYISLGDVDADQLKPYEKNAATVKLKESAHETVELRINPVPVE